MAALQSTSCRLCINICNGHRSLYDEDGRRNEVYALTDKYFKPLLLNIECVDHAAVVCMECWRHIFEFHTFQQSILLAQKMFVANKRTGDVVKLEVDEDEFGTFQTKSNASGGQGHNEVHEDLTNATTSTFCGNDDDADQLSEDVVKPEDRYNDSCSDEGDGHKFEAFVKSEVELIEYHITDYVSRDREVSTKNDRGFVTSDEESEEAHDPDAEWEGLDNPLGRFAGREFDKHGNETTEPDTERSIGSFSSDDEIPLAVQTRQCKAEPSNAKRKSKHTVSKDNSNETKKMRKRKSYERYIKQELNVSDAERSGERFNSDDELLLEETKRGSMQGEELLQAKSATELDGKPQIKTKYKRGKIMSNKSKLKRPQTVQEYDDFIAQWRSHVECVICSESYTRFSLLRQHFDKQHPNEECYILCCQIKLYHRYEIEKHIRFHIVPHTFKCDKCYKSYTEKYSLQLHLRRKHLGKSKGAISDNEIETHIHSHNEPNAFKCEKCCKCFADKSSLQVHIQRMHPGKTRADKLPTNRMKEISDTSNNLTSKQGAKRHTCEECGKVYKTPEYLQKHRRNIHLGLCKIVKCTICDKACKSSMQLREHMSQHTGKHQYTCQFCPKTFKYRAGLYVHFNKGHSKEWEERKKEKAALKKHKEKNEYKCSICEKTFQRRHTLLEHQARHEGKVLYTCTYCSKTFNYISKFYTHMKKEHPEEARKMKKAR